MTLYNQTVSFQGVAVVTLHWLDFKPLFMLRNLQIQHITSSDAYTVFAMDGGVAYVCTLILATASPGFPFQSDYTQSQNDADTNDFITNFQSTSNLSIEQRSPDGRVRTASEKGSGTRLNFYSHDWTDPTTWYQQSLYISGETLSNSGNNTTYNFAHYPLIDNYHGNITLEDQLIDANGHSYRISLYVNGAAKTEQDPHYGAGGDYIINYADGYVNFLTALNPTDVVTANYHYVNITGNGLASRFTIKPPPGNKITIITAEVQFSTDVNPTDSIQFEVWGTADFFLTSAQMTALGIPSGVGYKIMLQRFTYKTFSDFQSDAMKAYPIYPALGTPGSWRSQAQPIAVFNWDYVATAAIESSKGMEMHLYLQHDTPYTGWMGTCTIYSVSEIDN